MNFIGAFFIGDIEIAQHSITSIPTKKTAKNKLEDTTSFKARRQINRSLTRRLSN